MKTIPKDIKESVYHRAVISALAVGYTMLGKTLIKMSPPSLSKFDIKDGVKLVGIVALSDFTKDYLYEIPRPGVSLVKAWEINLVFNLVLAWKFRQIE